MSEVPWLRCDSVVEDLPNKHHRKHPASWEKPIGPDSLSHWSQACPSTTSSCYCWSSFFLIMQYLLELTHCDQSSNSKMCSLNKCEPLTNLSDSSFPGLPFSPGTLCTVYLVTLPFSHGVCIGSCCLCATARTTSKTFFSSYVRMGKLSLQCS